MPDRARNLAAQGPGTSGISHGLAERIQSTPSIQLLHRDPLMVISVHLTNLERFVFVRSVMPLYPESVNCLYDKDQARMWVSKLLESGFERIITRN